MAEHTFINPYTFVPLPEDGAVRSDVTKSHEEVFSGEIVCDLITKSQLAIPDILKNPNAPDTAVKEYDFFTLDIDGKKTATIPGSGIRGVIRSVFETLTDSCMHLNDKDDDFFHTRVNKSSPGILMRKGGGYVLYKAERLRDKQDRGYDGDDYYTGMEITGIGAKDGMNNASRIVDWDGGNLEGIYLRVDRFTTRDAHSHPSVFIKSGVCANPLDDVYVEQLKTNVGMYKGKYKSDYQNAIRNMEERGGQLPVWYWRDPATGYYYLAPSQYSRAVFVKKPRDIVKGMRVESCVSEKNACEACALFGFIGDDSRTSRVRFTDAECKSEDPFDGSYILPVLSGPQLSSFEFYLTDKGDKHNDRFGPDSEGVVIAGRKFYRHNPNAKITEDNAFAKDHPKMASKMQLVKSGKTFGFSVFFDGITDEQLKKLVFALNLGENREDSARCHKLGHGKPIGLGSAKIVVNKITKRYYKDGVYSVKTVTDDILNGATSGLFRNFREMGAFLQRVLCLNWAGNSNIDYPRKQPGGDIFKWFAANRGSLRSIGYISVRQKLPKITDAVQTLRGELPNDRNRGGNRGNNRGGYNGYNGYNRGRR